MFRKIKHSNALKTFENKLNTENHGIENMDRAQNIWIKLWKYKLPKVCENILGKVSTCSLLFYFCLYEVSSTLY